MTRAPRIAGVILAAGRSSRMAPHHKLDLVYDGQSLAERTIRTALASRLQRIVMVLGHRAAELSPRLGGLGAELIVNPDHDAGLSSSVKVGFRTAATGMDGVLLLPADMPAIAPGHLDLLIEAFRPGRIVVATDEGRLRNPVILPVGMAGEIEGLAGDAGARRLFKDRSDVTRVEIGPAASLDVDTLDAARASGGLLPGSPF